MSARTAMLLLVLSSVALAGCVSGDYARLDGVTSSAGDAIAANTVMQMVDPWPAGVENTELRVPSQRRNVSARGSTASTSEGYGG